MSPEPLSTDALWAFLPVGYLMTVQIETPVLMAGLSRRHTMTERLTAGLWLTAATYPIVVLVLPLIVWTRFGYATYLAVAETFAPLAECALFWATHRDKGPLDRVWARDFAVITLANIASFGLGVWLQSR